MKWRFIQSPPLPGKLNMAMDEAIYNSLLQDNSPPTLRLYSWATPCISLGNSQTPEKELNLDLTKKHGIDVVKRVTGGRAVLHQGELTYSVIARDTDESWALKKETSYAEISRGLLAALSKKVPGLTLDRNEVSSNPKPHKTASPCFSSTAKSEIIWQNKKLVGSAQRRSKNVFIQHGSILIEPHHNKIIDYQNLSPTERESAKLILSQKSVSVKEITQNTVTYSDIVENFAVDFFSALKLEFVPSALTPRETSFIREEAGEPAFP